MFSGIAFSSDFVTIVVSEHVYLGLIDAGQKLICFSLLIFWEGKLRGPESQHKILSQKAIHVVIQTSFFVEYCKYIKRTAFTLW